MKSTFMKLLAGLSLLSVPALGAVPAGAATTLTNGTFAGSSNNILTLYNNNGATDIPGWTVTSGSIDWIGPSNSFWDVSGTPVAGLNTIDLNGYGPGAIQSDSFTTVPGATYSVQFYLSGNNGSGGVAWTVDLGASGTAPSLSSISTTDQAQKGQWEQVGFWFVATSSSTAISFAGDPSNSTASGPVIADVSVAEWMATSGGQCKNGGWQTYANPSDGSMFMNQGQCVSYFATKGDVPIGSGK